MRIAAISGSTPRANFSACSGCTLCAPVCPVWRETRDLQMSPEGRCKALQHGAAVDDIVRSLEACSLCGACEPVCPEDIDLMGMVRQLRVKLPDSPKRADLRVRIQTAGISEKPAAVLDTLLVPGAGLRSRPELLSLALKLLGEGSLASAGDDISLALDAGVDIPSATLDRFLTHLLAARHIVVADGGLVAQLRTWLPAAKISSLGAWLIDQPECRSRVSATDLYVIDSRAYHADYEQMVKHYHRLREERGVQLNLDLQRVAVPAHVRSQPQSLGESPQDNAAHVRWLLKGRRVNRVITEAVEDLVAIRQHSQLPVIHITELAAMQPH